ncbi:MAG TPA: RyR domain-containing protein, partial [Methylovirgula sp.]|nr:RyR domain-containing protein [Methylovirgula sp.]
NLPGNMALVRAIHQAYADKAPPISCNIESNDMADEFGDLLGVQRDILIYDEARLSVRDTLARHPLYAAADYQGAARVHLVIIGYGRLGRVLLEEAVQDSITGTLEKPFITVIDANAEAEAAAFARDKPQYDMAVDIAFIACDMLKLPLDADGTDQRAAFFRRDTEAPVTAIAFCFEEDADNVAATLALRTMRRRSGRCFAPIFMPLQDPEGSGALFNLADRDRIVDPLDCVIPIGLSREALAVDILGEGERDRLAKRFHAAFRELADESQAANVSWVALPETYRRADRHAADHIPAKLWSLGLATERQSSDSSLAIDRDWQKQWAQELGQTAWLERIEHDRWIADRVMEGWRYALSRDDDLRHHNDLVPFDTVSLKDQDKDRKQIGLMATIIKEAARDKGRRFMPEFVVGLAADDGRNPAASVAARNEIGRQLAQPLADLSSHYVVTLVASLTGGEFGLIDSFASSFRQWVKRKSRWNRSLAEDVDLRLIVLEGVPYTSHLKSVHRDAKTSEHEIHKALAARRDLFSAFNRVEVVRVGAHGYSNDAAFRDPAVIEAGARSVNAYLARRADMLCVFTHGETLSGRLAELERFWDDADTIPPDIDPGPSRRGAPRPDVDLKRSMRINV